MCPGEEQSANQRDCRVGNIGGELLSPAGRAGHGNRERAAVWLYGETLTVEYADEPLAQYRVRYEPDKAHLLIVEERRLFEAPYQSPQSPLWEMSDAEWLKVLRRPDYAPRTLSRRSLRRRRLPARRQSQVSCGRRRTACCGTHPSSPATRGWSRCTPRGGDRRHRSRGGHQPHHRLSLPTEEWDNGPTKGHFNRLKRLKRQIYGRAKFDLLRQRLLYPQ